MSAGSLGSASGEILVSVQQALANLDALAAKLKSMDGAGGGVAKGIEQGGSRLDAFGAKVDSVSQKYGALGRMGMTYGAIVAAGFGLAITSAASFEAAMDGVGASLGGVGVEGGITTEQFQKLNDEALRIGANTSASAGEAAMVMDSLAKAGISAEQIYAGVAEGVVHVSEATGEGLQASADAFGSLTNLFADTGISAETMADVIVNGMNASNMSLTEFQTGISRLGPVIAATGMSFEDSAAAIAYFNSKGFSAAEVGTSLTAAFNNLTNPTQEQATAMQELGISAFDAQGKFVGFPAIMDQVADATRGMTDEQRAQALASVFGADAMDMMTIASKEGGAGLDDYTARMNQSGTAATASAQRMDNMKGAIEQLRGALESAMIVIGSGFTPIIRKLAEFLAGLVEGFLNLPSPIQKALTAIVGISGALAGLAGAMVVLGPKAMLIAKQMASLGGAITRLVPALLGLSAPILLIVAALALLAVAYKTNLFGFRDAVNSIASSAVTKFKAIAEGVRTFAKLVKFSFDMFRGQGQNPVEASLNAMSRGFDYAARRVPALAGAFTALSKASKSLGKFAGAVGDEFTKAGKIFKSLRTAGLNPVAAGFKTLGAVLQDVAHKFGPLDGVVRAAGKGLGVAGEFAQKLWTNFDGLRGSTNIVSAVLQAVGVTLGQVAGHFGPFEGAVTSIGRAFMNMGAAFNQGFKGVKDLLDGNYAGALDHFRNAVSSLGGAFKNFGSAAKSALSAVWDQLSAIDWGGVFGAAKNAIDGVVNAIRNVDWGSLIQGGWDVLYSGLQLAWDAVKDIPWLDIIGKITDLGSWLAGKVSDIPWTTIVGKLADFGAWLTGKVTNIPWAGLIGKLADFGTWLSGKVTNIPWAGLIGRIEDLGTWLANKVTNIPWAGLIGRITDFGTWLSGKVTNIPWAGLVGRIADFSAWLGEKVYILPWGALIGAIPNFSEWLSAKVPTVSWPDFVPDIAWSDFVPSLSWPSKDDILAAIASAVGLGGGDREMGDHGSGGGAGGFSSRKVSDRSGATKGFGAESTSVPTPDFSGITSAMTALQAAVSAAFAQIVATATTATTAMAAQVGSRFAAMSAQSGVAINQMRSLVGAAMLGMSSQVNATINQMAAQVGARMQAMSSQSISSANQMRGQVTSAMSGMASQGTASINQFASAVQSGFSRAVSAAHTGVSQIRGAVSGLNLYSQGYGIGSSLGQGIAAGIAGQISAIAAQAANAVQSAVAAANAAAKINSPSKLTMETGASLAEGLEVGISRGTRDVMAAMADLIPNANAALGMQSLPVTGRAVVINNNTVFYQVTPQALTNLMTDAQIGGDFARSMPRALMTGGGTWR